MDVAHNGGRLQCAVLMCPLVCRQIEMNEKYRGLTCGLCGDFNGEAGNELTQNGKVGFPPNGQNIHEERVHQI